MAFVYALIVPSWSDQTLPQLLIELFDTLSSQYRNLEHMHMVLKKMFFGTMTAMKLGQFSDISFDI